MREVIEIVTVSRHPRLSRTMNSEGGSSGKGYSEALFSSPLSACITKQNYKQSQGENLT